MAGNDGGRVSRLVIAIPLLIVIASLGAVSTAASGTDEATTPPPSQHATGAPPLQPQGRFQQPRGAADPAGATAVVTGEHWSCSLDVTGTVVCWGGIRRTPDVPGASGFIPHFEDTAVALSGTETKACALGSDGSLDCPDMPEPSGTFTDVGVGSKHSCAIRTDQTLECWGDLGGLGGLTPPAGTFTDVASGRSHSCAIRTDQTVACWGGGSDGEAAPPAGTFTAIDSGLRRTCGIRTDLTLECWGYSGWGQTTPPQGTFADVAAGYRHSCAIRTDQTLVCWGRDAYGEASPPAGTFTDVDVSWNHSCGVRTDGEVVCWGLDTEGQSTPPTETFLDVAVGDQICGIRTDRTLACWAQPWIPRVDPPGGTYDDLDVGGGHACARSTDGTVRCWGADAHAADPVPPGTYLDVDTGTDHTCALRADGAVVCWGDDSEGQSSPPAGTFTAVGAGHRTSCGARAEGTVVCWGAGADGLTPLLWGDVVSLDVETIDDVCGLQADGALRCTDALPVPPGGAFASVERGCGVRTDGRPECWTPWRQHGISFSDPGWLLLLDAVADLSRRTVEIPPNLYPQLCAVALDDGTARCHGPVYQVEDPRLEPVAPEPGLRYRPIEPRRVLDTRTDLGLAGPFGPGQVRELEVTGLAGVPPEAEAVVVNVTVATASAPTDVRVWAADQPRPQTSNVNAVPGRPVASLATVKVGDGGRVAIANQSGTTDLVADVVGAFTPDGDLLHLPPATRVLDTRSGVGLAGPFAPGQTRTLAIAGSAGVPADATAAIVNLTIVSPSAATDVRAWPTGLATPQVSNLNAAAGQTIANLAIVPLGEGGAIDLRNQSGSAHLVADLLGFAGPLRPGVIYTHPANMVFHPLDAARVIDSRRDLGTTGGAWGPSETRKIVVSGQGGVTSGWQLVNLTATAGTAATHLGLRGPTGTSTLNVAAGDTASNLAFLHREDFLHGDPVAISNATGSVHVIVDVVGEFGDVWPF